MATIFDVAKKAGVSITTVSRALNGYSDVNEKTRKRIAAIAEELNYYPNAAARNLQGKKSNTIAFAPWLRDHVESLSFFKEIVGVLALGCLKYDLSLLVTGAESSDKVHENLRELAGSGRVDGVILADIKPEDERIKLLNDIGIPFVAFGRTMSQADLTYPFVDVDGAAGIEAVVDYVVAQGHRQIAYLSGPFNTSYSLYRYNGYQEGLKNAGIEIDKELVIAELQEQSSVEESLTRLLALPEPKRPTAFITSSDSLALNIIRFLQERNYEIGNKPGQYAVTGFDDLPFAAFLKPALTTIRQPIEATCTSLLELLVALMKQEDKNIPVLSQPNIKSLGPTQFLLKPELIIRESA
jgi:DNA-binding LacI/PurR family transcriptional regulator